ncbi:universal stress protein [Couchioplanes caeruleus]|uniref:universal stress protein n=1 Tax=Couchioplanes caeruleus TaxID=56438 RepID=UPI0020BF2E25|nr:universal stress protein [Couchioplanes caeruleus]UQU62327.1 universal stress protein [Couchioplanes caeruleus]
MSAPVVVGFDGSAASEAAVRHGAREAALRGTELSIVYAFGWVIVPPPMYPPYDEILRGPRAALLDLLARTAHDVRQEWPDLTVTTRLVDGSPGAILTAYSRDAALLVVGHRGIGGFAGLLAGSTATQVAAHAASPVTVVRDAERHDDAVIVVGMDGSAHALTAAEAAFADARRHDAELVIVTHEGSRTGIEPGVVDGQAEALSRRYSDVKYRHEAAEGDTTATALIDAADRLGAAMIVVGSRGRGGFRGLIAGSTSRALIEHADRPVTVVPVNSAGPESKEQER